MYKPFPIPDYGTEPVAKQSETFHQKQFREAQENWFNLTFQQKLEHAHSYVIFGDEYVNKNIRDFTVMLVEHIINKTNNMSNDEIEKFLR